jgi:MscS family membrane protein
MADYFSNHYLFFLIASVLIALVGIGFMFVWDRIFVRRLIQKVGVNMPSPTPRKFFLAMRKPLFLYLMTLGAFLFLFVVGATKLFPWIIMIYRAISIGLITWMLMQVIDTVVDICQRKFSPRGPNDRLPSSTKDPVWYLKRGLQCITGVVGILAILDNLGYTISGIWASLGLGGAALALSLKDSIANFFAFVSIIVDKPFSVGDKVQIGADKSEGVVEAIGFRCTRISTDDRTLVAIPNVLIVSQPINNWSRTSVRRIRQTIQLENHSDPVRVEQFIENMRAVLLQHDGVWEQTTLQVFLLAIEPEGLSVKLEYSANVDNYKDVQQQINLKILQLLREQGLGLGVRRQI